MFKEVAEAVEAFELRELIGLEDEPLDLDDLSGLDSLTEEELARLNAELDAPTKTSSPAAA
ncbi:hypothetical protein H4R33_006375 [Dimargaris cristalligena]|nr:hypothetical protein H4R33_006375 [Dimargaris cristalligena]